MEMEAGSQRLLIISAGAFGREIAHLALGIKNSPKGAAWEIGGFLDDRPAVLDGKAAARFPILGSPDAYQPQEGDLFVCAIGEPGERACHAAAMRAKGGRFANLCSPRAVTSGGGTLGSGIVVGALCLLSCDIEIGDDVCLSSGVNVGHDVSIGAASQLSHGVVLAGGAKIGERVTIFPNATVLPGIEIGDDATVGAGSVVIKNVPAGETVFGVPAQVVRS